MVTLKERLRADLTTQLKARNELQTTTLRNLLGAITSAEKSGKVEVEFDDAQVQALLTRELKKRDATVQEYTDAVTKINGSDPARTQKLREVIQRENAEAEVIQAYLPQALTRTEVEALVDSAIAEIEDPTSKHFGVIMKGVLAAAGGRADGKVVSELVRAKLAG